MNNQSDESSKTFEATPNKLSEARKKGEFARSADLNTSAGYGGFVVAALIGGAASIDAFGNAMAVLLDQASSLSHVLVEDGGHSHFTELLKILCTSVLVWFLLPAAFSMVSAVAQRSIVFTPSKLKPKLSRISAFQNAKNKFGTSGLFEFAKNLTKITLISIFLGLYLANKLPLMAGILNATPAIAASVFCQILIDFFIIVFLISVVMGLIDYLWQYFDHLRRNRMSHKEIKDENKEQEGDPTIKQERRQRSSKIANQQTATAVASADVLIVNPSHYAVALSWSRAPGTAPFVVAKGIDHVALQMKEIAYNKNVPIRSDPPTARALFASTQIGDEIDQKHYRAVAAAIRFAESIRDKRAFWS